MWRGASAGPSEDFPAAGATGAGAEAAPEGAAAGAAGAGGAGGPLDVFARDGRTGGEVEAVHRGARGERGADGVARLRADCHGAAHGPLGADVARELARIDLGGKRPPRGRAAIGEGAR